VFFRTQIIGALDGVESGGQSFEMSHGIARGIKRPQYAQRKRACKALR
jgi:hypothetical protein